MPQRPLALLAVAISLLLSAARPLQPVQPVPNPTSSPNARFVPGELIVGFQTLPDVRSFAQAQGVQTSASSMAIHALNAAVVQVPAGQEEAYRQKLAGAPGVLFVEPNYILSAAADYFPNDPLFSPNPDYPEGQWGPVQIQAPAAWGSGVTGSDRVLLAVVDSGVDASHPDLAGRLLPGYDFYQNDALPQDECGHGSHVTGIAAANGDNGVGIAGMDWHAQVLPVRVLGPDCTGPVSAVAAGIVWAVDRHGADVINLSLGMFSPSRLLEYATYYAYQRGAALFAAAGNRGTSPVLFPAAFPWVMAVGATNAAGLRFPLSSTGGQLDLMAPGASVLSTLPVANSFPYGLLSGTSMAAAHASGAAALMKSQARVDTPLHIYEALTRTALDMDTPGVDANTGHGLIQLAAALAYRPIPGDVQPPKPLVEYDMLSSSRCRNIEYRWRDIPRTNPLFISQRHSFQTVALPFPFSFGGQEYTRALVSSNGYISFDGRIFEDTGFPSSAPDVYPNFIIPTSDAGTPYDRPDWFLAPYWDDLNAGAVEGHGVYQSILGEPPNREYVIEWQRMALQTHVSDSVLTFQVVLFEQSSEILFQYHTLQGAQASGVSATVGIEYNDGANGLMYSYNRRGALREKQAIRFFARRAGAPRTTPGCILSEVISPAGGEVTLQPFCLVFPRGTLAQDTRIHFTLAQQFSPLPPHTSNLERFADIILEPLPSPPLDPPPRICYHYSAADLVKAGGRPGNLYFAVYDPEIRTWEVLDTQVNAALQRIEADVSHFSVFGVFSRANPLPEKLPVTGASTRDGGQGLLALVLLIMAVGLWRRLR
ncbi:MAG TPA: S8 family serine peptidase [Levilinea sp.]|nr:S8 family serine peptidase [Levilinea sp.]